ncbi:MAG: hypothetical protein WC565_03650 [Parcubacteria group bacterium]
MKNRKVLIIIGASILVVLIGVLIFLSFKNPELLSKTPLEIVTGKPSGEIPSEGGTTTTPTVPTIPTSPTDFILPDSLWKDAFFVHFLDGSESAIVGIPSVPMGMELIAPMSGYVSIGAPIGGGCTLIIISENRDWSTGFALAFAAKSLKLLKDDRVQKGETFAVVEDNNEIKGFFSENEKISLTIGPVEEPNEVFGQLVIGPKMYVENLVEEND